MFIGRSDVEAETPIFWPPESKSWLTGKDPDAGKDGCREEKGTTKDEMVGWRHQWTWVDMMDTDGDHQWTWVWVNSGSWWWTWRPGVLQSMGPQRVRQDWMTVLNWRHLPPLWLNIQYSSTPSPLTPHPRAHKPSGTFCSGLVDRKTPSNHCPVHLTLHYGEKRTGWRGVVLCLVLAPCILPSQ